ncbi:hypothetical protein ACIRPR_30190 [Streptomyces griseoflavus]|uniref:hypothetical protein n=1 Tax=Streptomyces griseoflavus TaxID=35619 RepID=UPI0038148079
MGEQAERVDERDAILTDVRRHDAVRHGWLHRVATVACRDTAGRFLVHRRPEGAARFPGGYSPDAPEAFHRYLAVDRGERPHHA